MEERLISNNRTIQKNKIFSEERKKLKNILHQCQIIVRGSYNGWQAAPVCPIMPRIITVDHGCASNRTDIYLRNHIFFVTMLQSHAEL